MRHAFSTTQPITYPGRHSDKEEKSLKAHSKTKKKGKKGSDNGELPPIKKKETKKFGSYGKTMLLSKKSKHKHVSPYTKKGHKFSKFEY